MKVIPTRSPPWRNRKDYDGYIIFPKIGAAVFLSARGLLKMKILGTLVHHTTVSRLREHLG